MIPFEVWLSSARLGTSAQSSTDLAACVPERAEDHEGDDTTGSVEVAVEQARSLFQQEIDSLRHQHRQQLEAERALWCDTLRAQVDQSIASLGGHVVDSVSAVLTRILSPLLREQLVARAVAGFSERLAISLRDNRTLEVTVTGPAELLDRLKAGTESMLPGIVYEVAPTFELSAEIDGTILQTELEPWLDALKSEVP